ncbi:hypothetical protein PV325_007007, partial [Microctonus aethiopoides]
MDLWCFLIVYLTVLSQTDGIPLSNEGISHINKTFACQTLNKNKKCHFDDTTYKYPACDNSIINIAKTLREMTRNRCDIADPCRRAGVNNVNYDEKYDFIIVGAGVAGPVIARRLADREPWWKILLIEAGPEEPTMTTFPRFAFSAINSSLDWKIKTEPTKPIPTACLETNGICNWPRGKMVSGTGGMYGMMYVRGHPEIYNRWARAGNPGWSYNEIEHYFERAENPAVPGMTSGQILRRTEFGGPVNIDYFPHKPPFVDDLLSAADELGYKTSNLYGTNQTGFMVAPMMIDN